MHTSLKINCRTLVLAFVAGVLQALAYAPFEQANCVCIALGLLFWLWQGLSPWVAALHGYCYGLGLYGLGVSWVYVSVHDYGKTDVFSAGLVTLVFVAFWALFPALVGLCVAGLRQQLLSSKLALVITPILLTLVEYCRGYWVLNGFPWLLVGYTQLDTPLSGYIPLIGIHGTGFLLSVSVALAVYLIKFRQNPGVIVAIVLGIWGSGAALNAQAWTSPRSEKIKVSLIQGNISQDQKWRPENRLNTLMTYQQLTEQHWDSALIVWPESSIPAYLSEVDAFFITPLEVLAQEHRVDLLVSLPLEEEATGGLYNAVMAIGKQRQFYQKQHLLPFGEYLPLQPLSGYVLKYLGIRLGNFTAGTATQPLIKVAGYPVALSICYEDVFGPEVMAQVAEAAFLVNVTNDAWFSHSIEPYQHMQMARARALETGRYLLRATNTGLTSIVDAKGRILNQAPLYETSVLTDYVVPMQGLTPYAQMGDTWQFGGLLLLLIVICLWQVRRKPY